MYYKLGQACVKNWGSFIITNWGKYCYISGNHYYKIVQLLVETEAKCIIYKIGQVLQIRATITNWSIRDNLLYNFIRLRVISKNIL